MAEGASTDDPGRASTVRTAALGILVSLAAFAALRLGKPILVPVLVSALIACALEPIVAALIRIRVPRVVAAVVVFGALLAVSLGAVRTLIERGSAFVADLPLAAEAVRHAIVQPDRTADPTGISGMLGELERASKELTSRSGRSDLDKRTERVTVVKPPVNVFVLIGGHRTSLGAGLAYALAVALMTFLLMASGDVSRRKIVRVGGRLFEQRHITFEILKNIDRRIERYLAVRVLISGIVAALTAVALVPVGLHHWVAFGLIAGLLNVVPFVGPSIAVAAISVAAFLQFDAVMPAIAAGAAAGAVAILEGNLLTPWLTSRAGELNALAVFVGVIFWGWLWGVWGLVLAVPILVAVKAAADHIEQFQAIGELLGH